LALIGGARQMLGESGGDGFTRPAQLSPSFQTEAIPCFCRKLTFQSPTDSLKIASLRTLGSVESVLLRTALPWPAV
jgi:hypothetical protein